MPNERVVERQRVFRQYKADVKSRGKKFFPYAMLHDTIMSLVVVVVIIALSAIWKFTISDPIPEVQPAYTLVDLRADWQNVMGSPVDIGFFVKNVANKVYAIGSAHVINSRLGVTGIQYAEPRTFGVRVRARFGASAQ